MRCGLHPSTRMHQPAALRRFVLLGSLQADYAYWQQPVGHSKHRQERPSQMSAGLHAQNGSVWKGRPRGCGGAQPSPTLELHSASLRLLSVALGFTEKSQQLTSSYCHVSAATSEPPGHQYPIDFHPFFCSSSRIALMRLRLALPSDSPTRDADLRGRQRRQARACERAQRSACEQAERPVYGAGSAPAHRSACGAGPAPAGLKRVV